MELEKQDELGRDFEFESNESETGKPGDSSSDPNRPLDLPPEFCQYRDEGCELSESCLNCPFIKCIYDEPGGKQRWMRRLRDREIARLHIDEGKNVKELAEMFGISQRTVQRALKSVTDRDKSKQANQNCHSERSEESHVRPFATLRVTRKRKKE